MAHRTSGGTSKLWGPSHCKSIRSLTHLRDSDFTTSPTQVCMALMPWVWTCTSSKWATGFDTQTNPIKAEFSNLVSEWRFRRQGSVLAEDSFSATNVDRLQDFFQ